MKKNYFTPYFKTDLIMDLNLEKICISVTYDDLSQIVRKIMTEVKTESEKKSASSEMLSADEVSKLLGKSRNCLWRWQRDGILKPSSRLGRTPMYSKELIDSFIKGGQL